MSEPSLIPISEEQAKLGQEAIKAGSALGAFVGEMLGDLPKDLFGLIGGDFIKIKRQERIATMVHAAKERLRNRGIVDPVNPSPNLAIQFVSAAADENRGELLDLWARLLASAMDPSRQGKFRQSFIDVIKQFDPFDALVFSVMVETNGQMQPNAAQFITSKLRVNLDEVLVSLDNLQRLNCIQQFPAGHGGDPKLTSFGRLLSYALA